MWAQGWRLGPWSGRPGGVGRVGAAWGRWGGGARGGRGGGDPEALGWGCQVRPWSGRPGGVGLGGCGWGRRSWVGTARRPRAEREPRRRVAALVGAGAKSRTLW